MEDINVIQSRFVLIGSFPVNLSQVTVFGYAEVRKVGGSDPVSQVTHVLRFQDGTRGIDIPMDSKEEIEACIEWLKEKLINPDDVWGLTSSSS